MLFFEDEEQEWWGESREERRRRSQADHYDGEDAAKRLFAMAMLWALSGLILVSALTSAVAASVFIVTAKVCKPGAKPNYIDTFLASFKGTIVLAVVAGVLAGATMLLIPAQLRSPMMLGLRQIIGIAQPTESPGITPDVTAAWLWLGLLAVPSVAAYAGIMSQRMRGPFAGTEGYALSFCTSLVGLGLGLGLPYTIIAVLSDQARAGGLRHLVLSILVASVSLFVYSVIGAVVAGALLWLYTRFVRGLKDRALSYGQAYTAALLTLPLHSVGTALAWIMLTQHNPFRAGLWPVPHGGALMNLWETETTVGLANIAIRLLVAQVPGVILGAWVIALRLGGPYQGARGLLRAAVATGVSMSLTAIAAAALLAVIGF